jgi:uncharacterized protein (UPF0276 family)
VNRETKVCGVGLGYRYALAQHTRERAVPELAWLEIHPENYVERGGRFRQALDAVRERWPIVTHGLSMGFGASEPAEPSYLRGLRALLHELKVPWHSEHLCFSSADGVMLHDLFPLPFTREAVRVAVQRIRETRDQLELPIAVENISYYGQAGKPEMSELDFLLEVLEGADAALLLDVNNVYVNACNHGFDARAYIDRLPLQRVVQLHVAGHFVRDDALIMDTHGEAVRPEVYDLLEYTLRRVGPVPVLLERDQNFPPWDELMAEVVRIHTLYLRATQQAA